MSGGLFDWVGEVIAEIGSELAEAFGSDDAAGSNSGQAQEKSSNSDRERGRASYQQGEDLEVYTEQKLEKFGLNAVQVPRNFLYNETFEQYGIPTQVDVTIDDNNDNEVAIIECKAYTTKWNDVEQAQRLVHVAKERGIPLIFSTSDGTTDCFGSRVKEVLNETQCFVISPDNIFFADPSDVKENGITLGLPPEIKSHWNSNSSDSGGESLSSDGGGEALFGGLISSFVGFFGSSPDSESSDTSDSNSSDSGDSDGSWFGNLFGDSSDSESSDSSDCNNSDSDSSYSSDSGSSYSSDSGSSDYGNSGGSWDLFGGSSDSESSDSSDCSSSDSDSSYSSDSDSSYSSDSDSSYSSDSDSSYSSDSGSSDYGSGDYGDSGGSDSSSSSSDSCW
jgi:hypothetical protein